MIDRPSRRRFLQLVAAAPLSACVARTPAPSTPGDDDILEVVVIGAGLSGLVAAREIVRARPGAGAGAVRVLEARDRVGGRTLNQSIAGGAATVEGGGQWVGPTQTEILALVDELGLSTFPTYDDGDSVVHVSGFRLTGRGDFLEPDERADRDRAVAQLEAMAREIPLAAPWTAPQAARWDAITVAEWMEGALRTDGARIDLAAALGSTLGAAPRDLSLLYVLFYVASAGGYAALESIAGGAQERRIVGGSQLVALRLAEELGAIVTTGAPVVAVHDEADRVRVELADGTSAHARRVIVAMSPADTRRIRFSPPLPPARVALADGWRTAPGYKAHLAYDRPFWREQGLSGQAFTDGIVESTFDNSPPSGTPGVLLVFADRARLPDDRGERVAALAAALVPLFGDDAARPTDVVELDWSAERFTAGCVSPLPPGLLGQHGAALRAPVGRVHWAGTETSDIWNGYMDGAVRAGKRAAAEVLDAASGPRS